MGFSVPCGLNPDQVYTGTDPSTDTVDKWSVIGCVTSYLHPKLACSLRDKKQSSCCYFLVLHLTNGVCCYLRNFKLEGFFGSCGISFSMCQGFQKGKRVYRAPESTGQQYCRYIVTEKAFCGLGVLLAIFLSVTEVVANIFFLVVSLSNEGENTN